MKRTQRAEQDPQLRFYSRVFSGGFLHLGYFDDPATPPETMSLASIEQAQRRYAEEVLAPLEPENSPVLDVGCGMGGFLSLLTTRGFAAHGLTPDRHQIEHIGKTLPGIPLLHCRLEDLDVSNLREAFGAVLTAESLQYLDLKPAVAVLSQVLRPGGKWSACDYLPDSGSPRPSWQQVKALASHCGFRMLSERNITPHVIPCLRFLQMLGNRFGIPAVDFLTEKLSIKQPGLHYLLQDTLEGVQLALKNGLTSIDPSTFLAAKTYRLLVFEKV